MKKRPNETEDEQIKHYLDIYKQDLPDGSNKLVAMDILDPIVQQKVYDAIDQYEQEKAQKASQQVQQEKIIQPYEPKIITKEVIVESSAIISKNPLHRFLK